MLPFAQLGMKYSPTHRTPSRICYRKDGSRQNKKHFNTYNSGFRVPCSYSVTHKRHKCLEYSKENPVQAVHTARERQPSYYSIWICRLGSLLFNLPLCFSFCPVYELLNLPENIMPATLRVLMSHNKQLCLGIFSCPRGVKQCLHIVQTDWRTLHPVLPLTQPSQCLLGRGETLPLVWQSLWLCH